MTDLIYNHITAPLPGSDEPLLIISMACSTKEITCVELVKIDVEGEVHLEARHRLWHQQIGLRDPCRHLTSAAGRRLRAAHHTARHRASRA